MKSLVYDIAIILNVEIRIKNALEQMENNSSGEKWIEEKKFIFVKTSDGLVRVSVKRIKKRFFVQLRLTIEGFSSCPQMPLYSHLFVITFF